MERRRRNDLHKLDAYRCALDLYRRLKRIIEQLPKGEGDLRSQMNRARRSIPFNIGEGVGKRGKARAASYEIALGEVKETIVALDCVEIDQLAPLEEILAAQDLADRMAAMLTNLIRSTQREARGTEPGVQADRERRECASSVTVHRDRDRDRDRHRGP